MGYYNPYIIGWYNPLYNPTNQGIFRGSLGCPRKLVNGQQMGYNLLINGLYWGYNPLTNHLLTSNGTSKHVFQWQVAVSSFVIQIQHRFTSKKAVPSDARKDGNMKRFPDRCGKKTSKFCVLNIGWPWLSAKNATQ